MHAEWFKPWVLYILSSSLEDLFYKVTSLTYKGCTLVSKALAQSPNFNTIILKVRISMDEFQKNINI